MENDYTNDLIKIYNDLVILLKKQEELREETERKLAQAKSIIDPRQEFNKWLKTNTGKTWKGKQFEYQRGKCAACQSPLRYEDAVVHHVFPIKNFGRAANKPENFKLLHPSCNLKIGTKIVDLS
jgi:5-methylcytosine-specific restriction endonuclease McrA